MLQYGQTEASIWVCLIFLCFFTCEILRNYSNQLLSIYMVIKKNSLHIQKFASRFLNRLEVCIFIIPLFTDGNWQTCLEAYNIQCRLQSQSSARFKNLPSFRKINSSYKQNKNSYNSDLESRENFLEIAVVGFFSRPLGAHSCSEEADLTASLSSHHAPITWETPLAREHNHKYSISGSPLWA